MADSVFPEELACRAVLFREGSVEGNINFEICAI